MDIKTNIRTAFRIGILGIATASAIPLHAQIRAGGAMEFVDVATDTRLVASGGLHATGVSGTPSQMFHNPALIADSIVGAIDMSISPVGGGIKYASGSYVIGTKTGIGTFTGGIQYAGYGEFTRTDEDGYEIGTFRANEVALYASVSRSMSPRLTLGATIKPMLSTMDTDHAFALAMDFGASITGCDNRLTAALVIRNAGAVVKKYSDDDKHMNLPLDIKVGMTYKAEHAPFRFVLTAKDLLHPDLSVKKGKKLNIGDNILRHTLMGIEFVPVRAFYFAIGYDQRKRRELTDQDAGGLAGISWGCGLKVRKFEVKYAHSRYHVAGSQNSITISSNIRNFKK